MWFPCPPTSAVLVAATWRPGPNQSDSGNRLDKLLGGCPAGLRRGTEHRHGPISLDRLWRLVASGRELRHTQVTLVEACIELSVCRGGVWGWGLGGWGCSFRYYYYY